MDIRTKLEGPARYAATAIRRARKAHAHAIRQHEEAVSENARRRHARRAINARRAMGEAQAFYEELALIDFED